VITSWQLHVLTREFDPTQDGTVGHLPRVVEPHFVLSGSSPVVRTWPDTPAVSRRAKPPSEVPF
jgi:hypothetical protein